MSVWKRPLFWGILLALLLCVLLAVGFCLLPLDAKLKPFPCTYTFDNGDLQSTASVSLWENGTFTMSFSPFSSYLDYGDYTVDKDRLTLSLDGMDETYVFTIRKNTLIFDGKRSAEVKHNAAFSDGAIFR